MPFAQAYNRRSIVRVQVINRRRGGFPSPALPINIVKQIELLFACTGQVIERDAHPKNRRSARIRPPNFFPKFGQCGQYGLIIIDDGQMPLAYPATVPDRQPKPEAGRIKGFTHNLNWPKQHIDIIVLLYVDEHNEPPNINVWIRCAGGNVSYFEADTKRKYIVFD